ncbi:Pyruvate dehydrogenase E1 component subunit beta [Nocardia cerradoensis]|uniref:Pyruvate dehydrogenase E1 component subunit beta n=1 Tax=Nocardia cerradoensis TaxID=85688 RepID=A0A231H441_9NOCA|nr:Pyruvate dehydrogenase E1 component subunit beta [Nocardia cerradoensis]
MTAGPEELLDEWLRVSLREVRPGPRRAATDPIGSGSAITVGTCLELFDAQATSRHLDFAARRLGAGKRGYYSIGSSGHEGNVVLAQALRSTDPALLHYRSGAFFVHRCRQVPGLDPIRDVLLGVVAAAADPISGGRHKVFGSAPASVIPQTSTIASHLPRAMGLAFALDRARGLGRDTPWPRDAVVLCTFGDASANHSTAIGAINAAIHTAHQGIPMPLLFVCEDNGLGISVPTPPDWIESAFGSRPGLRYFDADGSDLRQALSVASAAAESVRARRRPALLRLRTVRLLGHAGSDVESAYRRPEDIEADRRRDPVAATARLLVEIGAASAEEVLAHYDAIGARVAATAARVAEEPHLDSAEAIQAPVVFGSGSRASTPVDSVHSSTDGPSGATGRSPAAPGQTAERPGPMTLAQSINHTLATLLAEASDVLVFGEDVGRKGGVYGVTKGLQREFGARRVFDTLLDEQSVLGTALGAGLAGFVPIPEIQYLAYVHNALDQIRGEAATLSYFSAGRYHNPMVVRIASFAYQRGFGGHFHNDNSIAALRDIPGVVVAAPTRADDAAAMLRRCVEVARSEGRVCLYLEPIALYHTRDLHRPGDAGWLAAPAEDPASLASARIHGDGADLTIVTFANGVPMTLRVARRLADNGIHARVLDLRWLTPLPVDDLLHHARATGAVLVADETRRSGGVSESVCTALLDGGFDGRLARVTSADSFVPLGPAAELVLLSETAIEDAAHRLLESGPRSQV